MLILISDAFDPGLPAKLEKFGEVTEDKSRLPEADVVLVRSKTKCTREYIEEAKNLKLIIRGGVGTDNIDKEAARENGIRVHNTPKAAAIAVAEVSRPSIAALIRISATMTRWTRRDSTHAATRARGPGSSTTWAKRSCLSTRAPTHAGLRSTSPARSSWESCPSTASSGSTCRKKSMRI